MFKKKCKKPLQSLCLSLLFFNVQKSNWQWVERPTVSHFPHLLYSGHACSEPSVSSLAPLCLPSQFFLLYRAMNLLLLLSLFQFLTSLSSLMPLLACLPPAWIGMRNYRAIPALVSVIAGTGSPPYLLPIKYLHKVRHLCQGKPSLPSFNVNMHLLQPVNVAPSVQVTPVISSSASALLFEGRCAVFIENEVHLWLCNRKSCRNWTQLQVTCVVCFTSDILIVTDSFFSLVLYIEQLVNRPKATIKSSPVCSG